MVATLQVLVLISCLWLLPSAHAVQSTVWNYFSNHPHTPASTHPVGLSFKRGIEFGAQWDFIEALDDSGRLVRYSRTQRVLQLIRFAPNGSFTVLQEATNVGSASDAAVLGASGYELMATGSFGAGCSSGECPNLVFYNRVKRMVEFWKVRDDGIEAVSTSTSVYLDAEGLAVGDWDKNRAGDELVLYDKFAGELVMFSPYVYRSSGGGFWGNSWGQTSSKTFVSLSRIRQQSWTANFEQLSTLDRDGDGTPELWFFNSDEGQGLVVQVARNYGIIGDSLPSTGFSTGAAFSHPVVVPGSGAMGRDEMLIYRMECDTRTIDCETQVRLGGFDLNGATYARDLSLWPQYLTHIVAFKVTPAAPPMYLLHSNRQETEILFVKLNNQILDPPVAYTESFAEEATLELNESFGPAGIGFKFDGHIRDFRHNDMYDWCKIPSCEDDDAACEQVRAECAEFQANTKVLFRRYASFLAKSQCVACVEDGDAFCTDNFYDQICMDAFTARCASECSSNVVPDQIVAFIHRHGEGFGPAGAQYLMLGDMDKNMSVHTYSQGTNYGEGHVSDRHGHIQHYTSSPKDYNFKHVIHEFGHFFGLGHDHFQADEETSICARDLDGEYTYNPRHHFISSDTAPKPLLATGTISKCCDVNTRQCTSGCWLAPDAVNYCTDSMLTVANEDGAMIQVNSDRTQPMSYGGNCDGIYRFSPVQLMNMRWSKERYTPSVYRAQARGYLFR